MNAFFFTEHLDDDPVLLKRIAAFNTQALGFSREESAALSRLIPDERMCAAAARFPEIKAELLELARQKGLLTVRRLEEAYWDFTEPSTRLALLPPEVLSRLGRLAAAALLGSQAAKTVVKPQVESLKKALGEDIYAYALLRGRYQAGALAADAVYLVPAGLQLGTQCLVLARVLLEIVRRSWPDTLQRLSGASFAGLDLPIPESLPETTPELNRRIWHFLKKLILWGLDSEWLPYFS